MADVAASASTAAPATTSQPAAGEGAETNYLGGDSQGVGDGQGSGPNVDPGAAAPKAEAKPKTPEQKFKVKISGKEHDMTPEQLIRRVQQLEGLNAIQGDLARQREELNRYQAKLKDPKEALALLREMHGEQFESLAESEILSKYEKQEQLAKMSPEQRALAEQNERMRAELEQYQQMKAQAEQQQLMEQERIETENFEREVHGIALRAMQPLNLPEGLKAPFVRRMLPLLQADLMSGQVPQPELYAEIIQGEIRDEHSMASQGLEGEALLSYWGEDLGKRLASAYLQKVKGSRASAQPAATTQQPKPKEQTGGYKPWAEWRK